MKGNQAVGMAGMQGSGMHMESPEVNIKTINGFQVQTVYDKEENSGAVTVFLTPKQTRVLSSHCHMQESQRVRPLDW